MFEGYTRFFRSIWGQIQYHSMLDQYEGVEHLRLFDDAYFEALQKRRDAKFSLMSKLMLTYFVVMFVLAMSVFGLNPEVSQFGVTVKVDSARDILLWITTSISMFLAFIHNDLILMQSMLTARIRHTLAKIPTIAPDFYFATIVAIRMKHIDPFGEHLPIHSSPYAEMNTAWNKMRGYLVGYLGLTAAITFIMSNIGLQALIVWKVWNEPALFLWLSRLICIYAIATNLLWIAFSLPYYTRSTVHRDKSLNQEI